MKVVLVGKGQMLSAMIEGCLNCGGVDIVGVLRYENLTTPRWLLCLKDFFNPMPEMALIKKYKLEYLGFNTVNSDAFRRFLLEKNVDVMLVGTWRERIKKEVFQIPKLASINIHPSLLPKYRGPNPYLQNIKNREKVSGFTFHLIDEGFDTGAILWQKQIAIQPYFTSKELRELTVFEVKNELPRFLVQLDKGEIIPLEQNNAMASYFPNIVDEDKMLDFQKETAEEIVARVKALHPWLPCYITLGNDFYIANPYKMEICKDVEQTSQTLDRKNKTITAICKDGLAVVFKDVHKY